MRDNKNKKKNYKKPLVLALALSITGSAIVPSFTTGRVYAANIDKTKESWQSALESGLNDDASPFVEGKIDDDHWQNNYEPRANTVGKSIQWASPDWSGDPDKNPYKFDIALLFASKYNVSYDSPIPGWENNKEVWSDEIEGLPLGIKFRYTYESGFPEYFYEGVDYTKMTPLASDSTDPSVEMGNLGTWRLPTTLQRQDDFLTAGLEINFSSTFEPSQNYIGPVPALPLNVSDGNDGTKIVYLTTKAAVKAYTKPQISEGLLGTPQTAPKKGSAWFNLKKGTSANTIINYTPYGIMDSNAEYDAEAVTELHKDKDHGTYKINQNTGEVTFTPDKDFPDDLIAKELEGIRVVTTAVRSDDVSDGSVSFEGNTPAYKLPKDDARRTWVEAFYKPKVLPVTIEVGDVEGYGKFGSTVDELLNLSQDDKMPAADLKTLTFVDSIDAEYPENQITEKKVEGEGTWFLDTERGRVSFRPEKGFAGNPTPAYYKVKNTSDVASTDDGDSSDNRTGTGTIKFEYSGTYGNHAYTTGEQGKPQTSFDNDDDADEPFTSTVDIFKGIPEDWYENMTFGLKGASEDGSLVIPGEGTYTIDEKSGQVTFTPLATFYGTADAATIVIKSGYVTKNGAYEPPVAQYTPTIIKGNVLVRDAFGAGSVGETIILKPNYEQLTTDGEKWADIDLSTLSFLDESGNYPEKPITSKKVDGEGIWTINPDTGEFSFEPGIGFAGTPTPQKYSAKNTEGLVADPASVGAVYGGLVGVSATTVDVQNKEQKSTDKDPNDNGLSKEEMFPNVPASWWESGLITFSLQRADQDGKVVIKDKGTYTIDKTSGVVSFTPVKDYIGKVDPVTIQVNGIKDETGRAVLLTGEYTPFISKDNSGLPDGFEQAEKIGQIVSITPAYGEYNIDPSTVLFENGTKELIVDGEGTWTVDNEGEFKFTPQAGFTQSPTPVKYTAVSNETKNRVKDGQVTVKYPPIHTNSATTVGEQGKVQTSKDIGEQDQGLLPKDMFPKLPENWYGEDATEKREDGSPLVKFYLKDKDGNNIDKLKVYDGDKYAGEYHIDTLTGVITFTPDPSFLGSVPKATVVTDGLDKNLQAQYTPFYFPARIELPNDRVEQDNIGAPTNTKDDRTDDMIWSTDLFKVDKDTIRLLPIGDNSKLSEDGKTLTVAGEGVWKVILEGEKDDQGEDKREVVFTFTPEVGFIGQPTELNYIAKNTNGVEADIPGQIVFAYPEVHPISAITTGLQGQKQSSSDKDEGDQGASLAEMFPNIQNLPKDWNLTYKLTGSDLNGEVNVEGQGTYKIENGAISFIPDTDFTGLAKPVTVQAYFGDIAGPTAIYTPVVEGFQTPTYSLVELNAGEQKTSAITIPDNSPRVISYKISSDFEVPEAWTVSVDENGTVTAKAPDELTGNIGLEVPVIVTYEGGTTKEVKAPFAFKGKDEEEIINNKVSYQVQAGKVATQLISEPTIEKNENGQKPNNWKLVDAPEDWKMTIDENGIITATVPEGVDPLKPITVKVKLTYPDGSSDIVNADFVGSENKTREKDFEIEYVPDENMEAGKQEIQTPGVKGVETLDENGEWKVTKEPTKQVVKVGTKPTTTKSPIPFDVETKFDENKPAGEVTTTTEGVQGEQSITITYTVDPETGEIKATKGEVVIITEPKNEVVTVGTKGTEGTFEYKTRKEEPFTVEVTVDESLKPGEVVVDQEGQIGITETKYTVDIKDSKPGEPLKGETTIIQEMKPHKVRVGSVDYKGTHDEKRTEEIPFDTIIKEDPNLPKGQTREEGGENGSKEITTTYTIENGEITNINTEEKIVKEPDQKIIYVGTGDMQPEGEYTREERIPYGTDKPVINNELKPGEVKVSEGKEGKRVYKYTITEVDGELVKSEEVLVEELPPVNTKIEVGPQLENKAEYETTRTEPYEVEVRYNPDLPQGEYNIIQEGKDTIYTTKHTITFDQEGNPKEEVGKEELTQKGQKHIIEVGTKKLETTKFTDTEEIPYNVRIEYDPNLAAGETREEGGVVGNQTNYFETVEENGQMVTKLVNSEVTKAPVDKIIYVGTKESTGATSYSYTEDIPFEVEYVYDENLNAGEIQVDQEGKLGQIITTVSFEIVDGEIVEGEPVVDRKEPVKKIVRVGTKPTTLEGELEYKYQIDEAFDIEVEYDDTLEAGKVQTIQEGQKGVKEITTKITLVNGEPTNEESTEQVIQEKKNKIIKVGTKCTCNSVELEKEYAIVLVNYVDEKGLPIKSTVIDSNEILGSEYDTADNKPKTIEFNGKTYEFVKVKDGDKEKGKTEQILTEVTYIYKEVENQTPENPQSDVTTSYVDENGKGISPKENGAKEKKEIDGYEFVKTEKDDKGNIKHVYKKKDNHKATTLGRVRVPRVRSNSTKAKSPNTGIESILPSLGGLLASSIAAIGLNKKKKRK